MIKILSKKLRNNLKVNNMQRKKGTGHRHFRKLDVKCLGKFFICASPPFPPSLNTNNSFPTLHKKVSNQLGKSEKRKELLVFKVDTLK